MTNYAELIAEAEARANAAVVAMQSCKLGSYSAAKHRADADYHIRLAAALRELAPPEGWRVTEYKDDEGNMVAFNSDNEAWETYEFDDGLNGLHPYGVDHPTASAAMAALDGESK